MLPAAADDAADGGKAVELFVLLHGLWGIPAHVENLRKALVQEWEKRTGRENNRCFEVLVSKVNPRGQSTQGVKDCGERLKNEVLEKLETLPSDLSISLSFVGYSFGGILARYVIGRLYEEEILTQERIECKNFITLATPHLGVRRSPRQLRGKIMNYFLDNFAYLIGGKSARDLAYLDIVDDPGSSQEPIMMSLANPTGPYVKALAMFPNRVTVSNVRYDYSVHHSSAAMRVVNPYNDPVNVSKRRFVIRVVCARDCPLESLKTHVLHEQSFEEHIVIKEGNEPRIGNFLKDILGMIICYGIAIGLMPFVLFHRICAKYAPPRRGYSLGYYKSRQRNEKFDDPKTAFWELARKNLEQHAPFSKVDVQFPSSVRLHAHGSIVMRSSFLHFKGRKVIEFVVQNCILY